MFDPLSILAAFAPVAVQAGNAVVQKFLAPEKVKALTVAEAVQLEQSDIDRLKAIAELDKPAENVSEWVSDVRALLRPSVALIVTMAWCFNPDSPGAAGAATTVWFYLFGERTLRK